MVKDVEIRRQSDTGRLKSGGRETRKPEEEKKSTRACTRADTGRISVSCEWGRGREQEREVGLDDIMCCYSPAERWQEDF